MRILPVYIFFLLTAALALSSFLGRENIPHLKQYYIKHLDLLQNNTQTLLRQIKNLNLSEKADREQCRQLIVHGRISIKSIDFFLRYFDPVQYKKINGPLPVEWETEVFEKYEKPYRRVGAGYALALQYLDEPDLSVDTLLYLLQPSLEAIQSFGADSNTIHFKAFDHFFLCNRLFLLNLAAIYTTGFDCPDNEYVIQELRYLLSSVSEIYQAFNNDFPKYSLPEEYRKLFERTIQFCNDQPVSIDSFDHFTFIRDYVSPLFSLNQELMMVYNVRSQSFNDYSLNKYARTLFSKELYYAQNTKGIFLRVKDSMVLVELDRMGKMLFYDPILSGNNRRSCVSCHKPGEYFTDTTRITPVDFNNAISLPRNTPSLLNVVSNHLIMVDGKQLSLLDQTKEVIQNSREMGSCLTELMKKIRSCEQYDKAFGKLLAYTPAYDSISIDHIASAITYYYGKFSFLSSRFDSVMNNQAKATPGQKFGFNVFMGKAKCATCHFVPFFNGVKPPYVGSEFEVLGVPGDSGYHNISVDMGRFLVNPAWETAHAFRTGTLRNSARTRPFMHNGVFTSLEQVIDFYDFGGGQGHHLEVPNQTLDHDSLHLTEGEKKALIEFLHSLNEGYTPETPPSKLPKSKIIALNKRKIGGEY